MTGVDQLTLDVSCLGLGHGRVHGVAGITAAVFARHASGCPSERGTPWGMGVTRVDRLRPWSPARIGDRRIGRIHVCSQFFRRRNCPPSDHHRWWLTCCDLLQGDWGVAEHANALYIIELFACYDQVDLTHLNGIEALFRRVMAI